MVFGAPARRERCSRGARRPSVPVRLDRAAARVRPSSRQTRPRAPRRNSDSASNTSMPLWITHALLGRTSLTAWKRVSARCSGVPDTESWAPSLPAAAKVVSLGFPPTPRSRAQRIAVGRPASPAAAAGVVLSAAMPVDRRRRCRTREKSPTSDRASASAYARALIPWRPRVRRGRRSRDRGRDRRSPRVRRAGRPLPRKGGTPSGAGPS